MQITDIGSFIKSLEITVPDDKEFLKLSKSTPMNSENVESHSINYERGILLYALIAKYKPQNVSRNWHSKRILNIMHGMGNA